ncbi:hypothetical protein D3C73_1275080 [compost metagenome]
MRAVDLVAGAQGQHGADRAAFLAHGRVRGAVHQAFGGQVQHGLFKGAYPVQLGQHGAEQGRVRLLPVAGVNRQLPPGRLGLKRLVGGHECVSRMFLALMRLKVAVAAPAAIGHQGVSGDVGGLA